MTDSYDVIVIGSGFGGAITACRLAQAGRSVCVLEKGRRWDRLDFPRGPGEVSQSALANGKQPGPGFIEYLTFRNMDIIQGTGVGGGSLHYFNVHLQPPAFIFDQPAWPRAITLPRLRPYYALASDMLGANPVAEGQGLGPCRRTLVFEDAANGMGRQAERVPVCVRFQDQDTGNGFKPGCEHCGNCLLGCHVHAKNTLDLNYIPMAEHHGARVLPRHQALNITPDDQGYTVTCADHGSPRPHGPRYTLRRFHGRQVVMAAGTLGTNELLLRCKQRSRTLPRLSPQLGRNFSGNGDFIFAGTHYPSLVVEPGRGPSITAGVGFQGQKGRYIYIEDLGYPDPFVWYFNSAIPTRGRFLRMLRQTRRYISDAMNTGLRFELDELLEAGFFTHFLPYLGMGTDAADGVLSLDRNGAIDLQWSVRNSLPMFREMIRHMRGMSRASGGRFINSFLWRTPITSLPLRKTLSAHPLGGCAMSDTPRTGVTNDRGEVWGYPGLFVADGALMPAALGVNPSATISAMAERVAHHMIHGRELREGDDTTPANRITSPVRETGTAGATATTTTPEED